MDEQKEDGETVNIDEANFEELKLSDLNINWMNQDFRQCNFELDAMQNEMLNFYLRSDMRFRMAFNTNWTKLFIQYLKDKARLHEPLHISIIGQTRSGKSVTAQAIAIMHSLLNGRVFSVNYVCANSFEFVDKLKEMPEEDTINSIFVIDEEKKNVQGFGSGARKLKLADVQNIIALNNISTISLTPDRWSGGDSSAYGLRSFGRCFDKQINRFMIYNLQEGGKGGSLPIGMVYLPTANLLLPERFAKVLEISYLKKKREWIGKEMRGENDAIAIIHKKTAQSFMRDDQFLGLKKKNERKAYIQQKLGSEWTTSEIETVLLLTNMMRNGVDFDE